MRSDIAVVRQYLQNISGVSSTWFEWEGAKGQLTKTLVVEVDFSTDPNSPSYRQNVMDAIESTVADVLQNETTMVVSRLRIVPKDAAL